MVDLSNETIETLFFRQIRRLTVPEESFDVQFSDRWLR